MTAAISDGLTTLERSLVHTVLERADEARWETLEVLKQALKLDHVLSLDRHLVELQNQIAIAGVHTPLFSPVDDVLAAYMRLAYWSQPWATRYPMLTGLGYMGSIHGISPADHLFTRVGASSYMRAVFRPDTAFASVPNALFNGTRGPREGTLGVPPHALPEMIRLLRKIMSARKLTGDDIAGFLPGPDFPTGGIILSSKEEIAQFYATGRGTFTVRGKAHAEPCTWRGARQALVVTQLPYGVALGSWIHELKQMMETGELRGIIDIVERGEPDDGPVHILLQPNRWTPEDIHSFLCRHTRFQCDIECEMYVFDGSEHAAVYSLEELVQGWLDARLSQCGRAVVGQELETVFRAHSDPRRTDIAQPGDAELAQRPQA